MAEIVPFKESVEATAWRTFEYWIRKYAGDLGYGSDAADWVVQDIKARPFRFQHNTDVGWGEIPPEHVKALVDWSQKIKEAHSQLIGEWIIQIVKIECELWAAKNAAKTEGFLT